MSFKIRAVAALCYIPPLFAFAVFSREKSEFAQAHLQSGLKLFFFGMCAVAAANAIGFALAFLPAMGGFFSNAVRFAAWGGYALLCAAGILRALRSQPPLFKKQ